MRGRLLTCYSPVRHSTHTRRCFLVRLACVKHAASVHPEPGSNSPFEQRPEAPSDRCESRFCFKTLRRGLGAPDREKVKACSLECPSDIQEDVLSVSRIPSSVSGCQGSAGGFPPRRPRERRKEILYAVSKSLSTASQNLNNFVSTLDNLEGSSEPLSFVLPKKTACI